MSLRSNTFTCQMLKFPLFHRKQNVVKNVQFSELMYQYSPDAWTNLGAKQVKAQSLPPS